MSNDLTKVFNGVNIGFNEKEQKVNLTNLWKAAGSDGDKRPAHWLQQDNTQDFVRTVSGSLNVRPEYILTTQRGRTGGTWAHKQIALAYAKYLSPELHMYVNQCFFERIEEENNPDLAITRGREVCYGCYGIYYR